MPAVATAARYRFTLELADEAGRPLAVFPLEREDFRRAVEATFFAGLRRGVFDTYSPPFDAAKLLPVFDAAADSSVGFEVVLDSPAGELRERFPLTFFSGLAHRNAVPLVHAGKIAEGTFAFRLLAEPETPKPVARGGWVLQLDEEEPTIPIVEVARERPPLGVVWDNVRATDFPVRVPRHVIDDAVEMAAAAPDREVGGVLLGRLVRDAATRELALEVSCLVPCEGTEATLTSVTFTHETWARVREVLKLRDEGELIVGWMHSHPFRLCEECTVPVEEKCARKVLFYSADDEFLMETTFARPFMVGLLAAIEPKLERTLGHPPVKLYGWKRGEIRPRGFEVIE